MVRFTVPPPAPPVVPGCGIIDKRQIMSATNALEQSLGHLEHAVKNVEWVRAAHEDAMMRHTHMHAAQNGAYGIGGAAAADLNSCGGALRELQHLDRLASDIGTELGKLCRLQQQSSAAMSAPPPPPRTPVPARGGCQAPAPAAVPATRLMLPHGGPVRHTRQHRGGPRSHGASSSGADTLVDARAEKEGTPGMFTLSASLKLLSQSSPECCFVVHHINKLRCKAGQRLHNHFSRYGTVVRVLVTFSLSRESYRPNSVGFIQMSSKEVVQKILRFGEEEVAGIMISVQPFVHKEKGGASEISSQLRSQGGPNRRMVELF